MKKIILIIASLFLATSVASASPMQNDLNFAFGGDVKNQQITLLDHSQMSEVRGKGWFKKLRKKVSKSFKKIGKKISWNENRYRYLLQIGGAILWASGVPVTPSMIGMKYTYVLP